MATILSTNGYHIQIDDTDIPLVSHLKWYAKKDRNKRYARAYTDGKSVLMHRLILGITDSKIHIDHDDGVGLNNKRENLRVCTHSQNQMNRKNTWGKSVYKGVSFHKSSGKFQARIQINKKEKTLGLFQSEVDAAKAYNEAALIYYGEFAVLNKI